MTYISPLYEINDFDLGCFGWYLSEVVCVSGSCCHGPG
jgi:hypothetical protein